MPNFPTLEEIAEYPNVEVDTQAHEGLSGFFQGDTSLDAYPGEEPAQGWLDVAGGNGVYSHARDQMAVVGKATSNGLVPLVLENYGGAAPSFVLLGPADSQSEGHLVQSILKGAGADTAQISIVDVSPELAAHAVVQLENQFSDAGINAHYKVFIRTFEDMPQYWHRMLGDNKLVIGLGTTLNDLAEIVGKHDPRTLASLGMLLDHETMCLTTEHVPQGAYISRPLRKRLAAQYATDTWKQFLAASTGAHPEDIKASYDVGRGAVVLTVDGQIEYVSKKYVKAEMLRQYQRMGLRVEKTWRHNNVMLNLSSGIPMQQSDELFAEARKLMNMSLGYEWDEPRQKGHGRSEYLGAVRVIREQLGRQILAEQRNILLTEGSEEQWAWTDAQQLHGVFWRQERMFASGVWDLPENLHGLRTASIRDFPAGYLRYDSLPRSWKNDYHRLTDVAWGKGRDLSLLVVGARPESRLYTQALNSLARVSVQQVTGPDDAVEAMNQADYDAVVVAGTGDSGHQGRAFEAARRRYIPYLFFASPTVPTDTVRREMEAGAAGYVTVPTTGRSLQYAVASAIYKHRVGYAGHTLPGDVRFEGTPQASLNWRIKPGQGDLTGYGVVKTDSVITRFEAKKP